MSTPPTNRAELRRARRRRRQRLIVAAAVGIVVVAAGVGVAATSMLSGDDDHESVARVVAPTTLPTTTTPTTTVAPTTSTTADTSTSSTSQPLPTTTTTVALSAIDVDRRYAVSTYDATYVDSTRSTSPNGSFGGAPNRTLPTTYWFPAVSDGGAPDRVHGPYPLVLFVHGYDQTPQFYAQLLERWASAGYVVAAPTFPILSGIPGGASHVDYGKLFGDAGFVISQTLAAGAETPIGGLVDGRRIAAVGHSDGEMVTFTLGFSACCRDPRIRSVIAMAGDLSLAVEALEGEYAVRDTGLPILHVMETNDEYDPYPHTIQWDRENLTAPRWMLTLLNASHAPPYTDPGAAHFDVVSTTTIDFLDGTLKGHPERLDRIATDVAARPDLATLER